MILVGLIHVAVETYLHLYKIEKMGNLFLKKARYHDVKM